MVFFSFCELTINIFENGFKNHLLLYLGALSFWNDFYGCGALSVGNSLCPRKNSFNYTWIMVIRSLWENITMYNLLTSWLLNHVTHIYNGDFKV